MPTLRITDAPSAPLDLALATHALRLTRSSGEVWLDAEDVDLPALRRAFAYAGAGLETASAPPPPTRLVAAVARALDPSSAPAYDVVSVLPVSLATATRQLLRRTVFGVLGAPRSRRESARALLHGTDAICVWERRAWLPRQAFVLAPVRALFRPILLDRGALQEPRPGGSGRASDGRLSAWLAG